MPLKGSGGAFVTAICSRITHAELLMCLFGMDGTVYATAVV